MQAHVLPLLPGGSTADLRSVLFIQTLALAGLSLALLLVGYNLNMQLPYAVILGVLLLLAVTSWLRTRCSVSVREGEVFAALLVDVAALGSLLYFIGGATNPFVLLLLLPVIIAAATLCEEYAWGVVAAIVGCYTLLMFFHIPLPNAYLSYSREFDLETWGMWFGFVMTAELINYLVMKIANTLRSREQQLSQVREQVLRDERLVALGALAVGTAHELGTPLGTMAILLKDLERDYAGSPELFNKLLLLRGQVERCKFALSSMLSSTGQARAEGGYGIALDAYLDEILAQWRAMRPGVILTHGWAGELPAPCIMAEKTLGQALLNILNNAADVSPHSVEVTANWNNTELQIRVADRGPGLPPEIAANAGKLFFTTKESGHGVGLYLAQTIFGRFGGTLQLRNRAGGGAYSEITLPLARLLVNS